MEEKKYTSSFTRAWCGGVALVFGLFLLGMGLWTFLAKPRQMSENENRELAQLPAFSVSAVMSGTFQTDLESFMSDQFPGRDKLMPVATRYSLLLGKNTISDTFVGKDGYLFERKTEEEMAASRFESNLGFVVQLIKQYPLMNSTVCLVPSPATILSDKLPAGADEYNAETYFTMADAALGNGRLLDLRKTFYHAADAGEYIYFHTDHHWTIRGAYLAFRQYMKSMGADERASEAFAAAAKIQEHSLDEIQGGQYPDAGTAATGYEFNVVSEDFYGTLYSRTIGAMSKKDSIELVAPLPEMEISTGTETMDTPYVLNKLYTKDKYTVYMGGNYGRVDITVKNPSDAAKGKTLLLIKDSYANCIVPFLCWQYEYIIMVDLRYFYGSVMDIVEKYGVTDMLVLYEMTHFADDSHMIALTK